MLQALLRRIATDHPKREKIEDKLRRHESGYKGEVSIDYYLSFLPDKTTFILHDLRLKDKKERYFQMDSVIITSSVIFILDVKNHAGTLTIDPNLHQMIQSFKDKEDKVYDDPVLQGLQHEQQLKDWLAAHNFPPIPIVSLVIFSNQFAIIKLTTDNPQYLKKITRSTALLEKMNSISQNFKQPIYTEKDCNKLSRLLIKSHVPKKWDVLSMFDIKAAEIIPGPHCPICNTITLSYNRGIWTCHHPQCGYRCTDAFIPTLSDFVLLYGKKITNSQCRWFLQIDSPSVGAKILKKLKCKYSGNNKGRIYELPEPILCKK